MTQLRLFDDIQPIQSIHPQAIAPGGLEFKQFISGNLSTTSRSYVDMFSFDLSPGSWFIQVIINGVFRNSQPFLPMGVIAKDTKINFRLNKSTNRALYTEAEQLYNIPHYDTNHSFMIHMTATTSVMRGSNLSIATCVGGSSFGDILLINNITINANKLTMGRNL